MDPLSLAVSALALLSACTTSIKIISETIWAFKRAPEEVKNATNGLSDLAAVLDAVGDACDHGNLRDDDDVLHSLLSRARSKLEQLHSVINGCAISSRNGKSRLDRAAWLRQKPVLQRVTEDMQNIKQELHALLTIKNLNQTSRIKLAVDSITIESADNHTEVLSRFDQISSAQDVQRALLENLLRHNPVSQPRSSYSARAFDRGEASSNAFPYTQRVKLNALQKVESKSDGGYTKLAAVLDIQRETFSAIRLQVRRQNQCHGLCNCICHSSTRMRTPTYLNNVIGVLFLGYSGMPLLRLSCSVNECKSYATRSLDLIYTFPKWILQRAIYLVAAVTANDGPMVGLTIRRRIEYQGENNIFQMAVVGNAEGVRELLSRRLASPNDLDTLYGESALYHAVKCGHRGVAQLLLAAGADPDILDDRGISVSEDAWIRMLAESNDSKYRRDFEDLFPASMYLDSFEFTDVHRAVLGLLPIKVNEAIDNPVLNSQLNTTDSQGRTPIFWAALRGDYQTVEQLLIAKADFNTTNCSLDTPVHAAAKAMNVRTLEILLMAGASVEARDCFGFTPLHKVCRWQTDAAYAKCLILAGAPVNATNRYGTTALARAARYDRDELALTLINNKANMNLCNKDGSSPINEAIMRHSNKVLRLLISKGADYTTINNAGWSLLHTMANYGSIASLQILSEFEIRGLDPLLKDNQGKTPQEILHTRVAPPLGFVAAFEKFLEHITVAKAEDEALLFPTVSQNTMGVYESDEECFYNASEWISTVS